MNFEMTFLVAFYALMSVAVSVACVAILVQSSLLGMLVVVVALFAAIGVLAVGLLDGSSVREHDADLRAAG